MDDFCGDNFESLEEANSLFDAALDELENGESIYDAGHAIANLLYSTGDAFQAVVEGVCMDGFGEQLESLELADGEIAEAAAAVLGEGVEMLAEVSLAVSEPLISGTGEILKDCGEALHSAIEAVEQAMAGQIGEGLASAAQVAAKAPEVAGDILGAIPEVFLGGLGETIEGTCEIGRELVEGIGEASGFSNGTGDKET
jgi:hypothetical protein